MLPPGRQTLLCNVAQGLTVDNDKPDSDKADSDKPDNNKADNSKPDNKKPVLVLGIETTCDETAAAVVERRGDGSGTILSNIVHSQLEEHARFGGVVPEIAARAHVDLLDGIIGRAMNDADVRFADLSAVAAAAGPGLIGGVI